MKLPRRVGRESDGRWTEKRNFEWLSHCEWFEIKGERWDQEIESRVKQYWSTSEWETISARIGILFNYCLRERDKDNYERLNPKSEDWRLHISVPSITIIWMWREKESHPCERIAMENQKSQRLNELMYKQRVRDERKWSRTIITLRGSVKEVEEEERRPSWRPSVGLTLAKYTV